MSGPRHDAYRHYVTQLEALHAAAHHPSAARIAAEIRATTHGPVVSASTIRGWLAEKQTPRTIPRDGAKFALVLAVLHRLAGRRFDRHIPRQWDTWRDNASQPERPADRPEDGPAPQDHRAEPAPSPSNEEPVFEVDRILRQEREWAVHAEQREVEFGTRLLVRAKGNQDQRGWWFCGRHTALRDIADWLHRPDPTRPLLPVTGDPGSGKTAVLGLIATLDRPFHRRTVPIDSIGLPADAIAPPGTIDVAIYAQGLTIDQVRDGIAAAARIPAAETVGALVDGLAARATVLTVLIDGLDEAADPRVLVQELLRPLLVHASRHVRLLVGTRPYLLDELGTDREHGVDLDDDRYADLEALTAYTVRGLRDADPDSIYPTQPLETVRAVAAVVAEQAHRCFLVARIVAATLAATPTLPEPTDPAWRASLPSLPGDAMRDDLDTRLREKAATARDLLLPLAFAQGQGLPWEDLWKLSAEQFAAGWYGTGMDRFPFPFTFTSRFAYRDDYRAFQAQFREMLTREKHRSLREAFRVLAQPQWRIEVYGVRGEPTSANIRSLACADDNDTGVLATQTPGAGGGEIQLFTCETHSLPARIAATARDAKPGRGTERRFMIDDLKQTTDNSASPRSPQAQYTRFWRQPNTGHGRITVIAGPRNAKAPIYGRLRWIDTSEGRYHETAVGGALMIRPTADADITRYLHNAVTRLT